MATKTRMNTVCDNSCKSFSCPNWQCQNCENNRQGVGVCAGKSFCVCLCKPTKKELDERKCKYYVQS